jgi:hypothetical protein
MLNEVQIIENFISKDSCDFLIKNFEDTLKETSNTGIFGGPNQGAETAWYLGNNNPIISYTEYKDKNIAIDLLTSISNSISRSMSEYYNVLLDPRSIFYSKMIKGANLNEHYDNYEPDGSIFIPSNHDHNTINKLGFESDFSGLLYLNDNYEGGEIVFPKQNISLKPKPGTLIFFSGDMNFPHSVNEVLHGSRYNLVSFFWRSEYRKKYFDVLNKCNCENFSAEKVENPY